MLRTELTKVGERILTVESTLNSTTCRRCGRTITERHGLDEPRLLRHLPVLGRVVFLRIRPKRFRCPFCEGHPTTQHLDWYDPKAQHIKVQEVLPDAMLVLDRFHVARHYRDVVDELRKQEVQWHFGRRSLRPFSWPRSSKLFPDG